MLWTDLFYITIGVKGYWIFVVTCKSSEENIKYIFNDRISSIPVYSSYHKEWWMDFNINLWYSVCWSLSYYYVTVLQCEYQSALDNRTPIFYVLEDYCSLDQIFLRPGECACFKISAKKYNLIVFRFKFFNQWLVEGYLKRSELLCPMLRYVWALYIS